MFLKNVSFAQFFVVGILVVAAYQVGYTLSFVNGIFSLTANIWNPSWLLFGPFLYLAFHNRTKPIKLTAQIVLHSSFFLIALVCFLILEFLPVNQVQRSLMIKWYDNMFFVVPALLTSYIICLLPKLKRAAMKAEGSVDLFFLLLAFFITLVLMTIIIYVCKHILAIETGVNYHIYINYLLVSLVVFTIIFLVTQPQFKSVRQPETVAYAKSPLKATQVQAYIQKIEDYFKNEQSFLQYNITLDSLAHVLGIPKAHLTQVFNVYLNTNFYTFLASYRIEYALNLIHDSNMTVEALAHECGFSSKTSFNKHFKAITGYSPAVYVAKKAQVS